MMKKKIICILMATVMLCTACKETETGKGNTKDLRPEITEVLQNASYDNLEILFDEMGYYEGQDLVTAEVESFYIDEEYSKQELMELYANVVFPSLLDVEEIDRGKLYDLETKVSDEETDEYYYSKNYEEIMSSLGTYEETPNIVYYNPETYTKIYYSRNWRSGVYSSQGVLGTYAASNSPFGAYGVIEEGKEYDCRLDDLSDTYMLMDGEKSLSEAKEEIEDYLDEHYPITGKDNGFKNEVYNLEAGKITGTDYYAFKFYRTLSYDGIPIRGIDTFQDDVPNNEFVFAGEGAMCESNKLDVTIGIVNTYEAPKNERVIKECIPFSDIMDTLAAYLTGESKFRLLYGGIEYRMFYIDEKSCIYEMIPYWYFIAQNPNDDTMLKLYVNVENGEIFECKYEY